MGVHVGRITRHGCPNCMTVLNPTEWKLPPFSPSLAPRDILETNDAPFESQVPFLRDFVSRGRTRMIVLEYEMALLQASLDKLAEERDGLDIEIRKHEGALSPLRRTPTEILSLVFSFTLSPDEEYVEPAPWTLSAVCARWRATVISQPCLWTSINLDHSRELTSIFRLEAQLRRSGELPLEIEFSTEDTALFTPEDVHRLRLVCRHARRWKILDISGPEELFTELQGLIQDPLALLWELTIEMQYESDEIPSLKMFTDAPLLQRVTVNKGLWAFPVAMELPWSQLLRYVGSNTWDGHLGELSIATNLVDCSLELTDDEPSAVSTTPIVLPNLLRLFLSVHPAFLECLDTPALLELYCECATPVLAFLHRQRCKIKKLVLWESSTPPDGTELTRIVEAGPTVTTLALPFSVPVQFILNFSRPTMAPALEHFLTVVSEDHDHFTRAIESRWQAGHLKSVKILLPLISSNMFERMELLQDRGLKFEAV
ncbi:hypothetical protein DFH06DRAFT_1479980 [Mycena polygramma]|nr:hypothetical protein DFH06DRAFT_1479980 [Mycena polygramma]